MRERGKDGEEVAAATFLCLELLEVDYTKVGIRQPGTAGES